MDDCISRQDVIDHFRKRLIETANNNVGYQCDAGSVFQDAAERIRVWANEVPAADVQPRKTAEWVYGEKDGADGWYCSKCGFHIPWYYDYYGLQNIGFIHDFHTCPHCDAKMDERSEE